MLRAFFLLVLFAVLPAGAMGAAPSEALDRGHLSLAWDAHESALCDETLEYVEEIPAGSVVEAEALWLKADCLLTLGRYPEAAAVLEAPSAGVVQDREGFLLDVYAAWVRDATARERYDEALSIGDRGLRALPDSPALKALRQSALFRQELRQAVKAGRLSASRLRLSGAEEVMLRPAAAPSPGSGWTRAYPWRGDMPWAPEVTLADWMPSLAARLDQARDALWIRVPADGLRRATGAEIRKRGLSFRSRGAGATVVSGADQIPWDAPEWVFRAGAEGLGLRGAALAGASQAVAELENRGALVRWVTKNRGVLEIRRLGQVLRVRHPATGRTYDLDPAGWAGSYDPTSREWRELWTDIASELGRAPGPFRCFCGRDAVLRETLVADPGAALVVEKGQGYALVLTALCPLHQQYVTKELLETWGVSLAQAWKRAQDDAVAKPWELAFERGQEKGTPFLALEGEGASSLARRPDLLLGALEAVEGIAVRGTSVSVMAPTLSSLVVLGAEVAEATAQAVSAQVILREARRGARGERVGYRNALKLPQTALGVFDVRLAQ